MSTLFVTGRLAEPALRGLLAELGIEAEVAVLPISVAALMTPRWVARHLVVPEGVDRVILPGHCRGDLSEVERLGDARVDLGPEDLRDLPQYLTGKDRSRRTRDGTFDVEILAEINHAPSLEIDAILGLARRYRASGADVIDLGCRPGVRWTEVGRAVRALRDEGFRVSIDSFDPVEVQAAVSAGAELVLSVNATNRQAAVDWGVEVVVIPDEPHSLEGLQATAAFLERRGVPFRLDPILDPIAFGFAASLGRYLETRARFPGREMMMGVGNLSELTDVDSSGVNTLLIGFCQEVGVRSVLTTEVVNWARSSVKEIDLARRLMYHAVREKTLPKHLEPGLVALRDPKVPRFGPEALRELAARVKDENWRIFAEDDTITVLNGSRFLSDRDPFRLFDQMGVDDPSHAFYLGHELMKARTALDLGKSYRQDQALSWGHLTVPEESHLERKRRRRLDQVEESP